LVFPLEWAQRVLQCFYFFPFFGNFGAPRSQFVIDFGLADAQLAHLCHEVRYGANYDDQRQKDGAGE